MQITINLRFEVFSIKIKLTSPTLKAKVEQLRYKWRSPNNINPFRILSLMQGKVYRVLCRSKLVQWTNYLQLTISKTSKEFVRMNWMNVNARNYTQNTRAYIKRNILFECLPLSWLLTPRELLYLFSARQQKPLSQPTKKGKILSHLQIPLG